MQSVYDKINAKLEEANEVVWTDLVSDMTDREKRVIHPVLRDLKNRGVAWRRVTVDSAGKSIVHVVKGAHPNRVKAGE